jgi:RNA polymerase sigma factor (sigma-70 family)
MVAPEPSDAALVHRLRESRDIQAFAELYDRYGAQCFSVARRIVNLQTVAEDVTQEVFAAVWEHPEKYDARRGPFQRWLLYAVHNKAIDALRCAARRATSPINTGDHPIVGDAADTALGNLDAHRVRAALAGLPHDQREALRLAYWHGCTHPEIARATGAPVGTVKWRIHAAVKRLAADLRTTTEGRRASYG